MDECFSYLAFSLQQTYQYMQELQEYVTDTYLIPPKLIMTKNVQILKEKII